VRLQRSLLSTVKIGLLAAALLAGAATDALANGSISGTVTGSSSPLAGVVMQFYNLSTNDDPFETTTDGSGSYTMSNLPPGPYGVLTQDIHGFINEIWNNHPCSTTCDTSTIDIIDITDNVVTGINFDLAPGGRIEGTITDGVNPIAGIKVYFVDQDGELFFTSAITDALGHYISNAGMATGHAFVLTTNNLGYFNELYDNIPCLNCNPTSGTQVPVTLGATTSNINFVLALGGRITGTVTDATPNPVANVQVTIFDSTGNDVDQTLTNASGNYSTAGLPSGTYYAGTNNHVGLVDELYNNIICPHGFCNPLNGTAITVTSPSTTANINFALAPGGTLTGTVTAAAGGAPISGLFVGIFNSSGFFLTGANTDGSGVYSTTLPTGTFYAAVINAPGWANQLYNGIACGASCNITSGTPISVTAGSTTGNINFSLLAGGNITGTVINGATMTGINGIQVQLYSSTGSSLSSVNADANGVYTFSGLSTASYYVKTNGSGSFINQLYNGVTCVGTINITTTCPGGTLVSVTAGATTSNINFTLATGGRISGTITNSNTALGIQGVNAQIFNSSGTQLANYSSDSSGNYITSGLLAGTYYVRTSGAVPYVHKLYNNLPCTGGSCTVTTGTPIVVTVPSTTSGINFSLDPGGQFSGTITNATTALGIQGVNAQIYNSSGTFLGSAGTNASGIYTTSGLPTGTYYSHTRNNQGYIEKLYNNLPCTLGSCSSTVTSGTPISVTVGANTSGINYALDQGGRFSGTITNSATGAPIASVSAFIYTSGGTALGTSSPSSDASGNYTTGALPPGTYYARTNNFVGYTNRVYDNKPWCPGCLVPAIGQTISVVAGQITPSINFKLLPTFSLTDPTLTQFVTPLKAVHILELRTQINLLRQQLSIAPASFTDPTLTVGVTVMKGVHVTELRTALDAVYDALGWARPTYTDPTLVPGTTVIKLTHLLELRGAVHYVE
jgi:hypothetical protein